MLLKILMENAGRRGDGGCLCWLPGAQTGKEWMGTMQASWELLGTLDAPVEAVFPDQLGDGWCLLQRVKQEGRRIPEEESPQTPNPQPWVSDLHTGLHPFSLRPSLWLPRGPLSWSAPWLFLGACCPQNGNKEVGLYCALPTPRKKEGYFALQVQEESNGTPTSNFNVGYSTPTMENVFSKRHKMYPFSL